MNTVTWLHLSDLHFRAGEQHTWDRNIILRELLDDILRCMNEYKLAPDLILVSGDIAFCSSSTEYALARGFFDELLKVSHLSKDRLLLVPGNHDVDRSSVSFGAEKVILSLEDRQAINSVLIDKLDRRLIFRKFDRYGDFVRDYLEGHIPFDDDHYFYIREIALGDHELAILGLNSAWLSYSDRERGHLALGEDQVRRALDKTSNADVVIALLHHPLDWLKEFDLRCSRALLMRRCNLVLHGHIHYTQCMSQATPDAQAITIAAGACYDHYEYPNSYNWIRLNLDTRQGTIFPRTWSNQDGGFWTRDTTSYHSLSEGKYDFHLDQQLYSPSAYGTQGYLGERRRIDDSLVEVELKFSHHSDRALEQINLVIPGMDEPLERKELGEVEHLLQEGRSVILTGDAGTGKSSIGAQLAHSGREKSSAVLFIDARRMEYIQNETGLRQHFDLGNSIYSTVERIAQVKRCRLIIDHLDRIAGTNAAMLLAELATECSQLHNVEVIVISRDREEQESKLVKTLAKADFERQECSLLSKDEVENTLHQLNIWQSSPELVELGHNLFNLELIGTIKQQNPDFDSSRPVDEIDLWEQYVQVLPDREEARPGSSSGRQIVAEAVRLAREALRNEDASFCLDDPLTFEQRRLVSWGIIVCEQRVCRFRHEGFRDFLYAWDATQRHAMRVEVYQDLDAHRATDILVWMERIYSRQNTQLRNQFLRDVLNVR